MAGKLLNIISTVIVILSIITALLLAGVRLFGINPYVVTSGSMEPELHVGSIVYVKPVDTHELKAGDIITFRIGDDTLATHRVMDVISEGGHLQFVTKGDANDTADVRPVDENNVVGKVIGNIPVLGRLENYISTTRGKISAACGAIILMIIVALSDYLTKINEQGASE